MSRKVKVSFRIREKDLQDIDYHVRNGIYKDRSEAINAGISLLLGKLNWGD